MSPGQERASGSGWLAAIMPEAMDGASATTWPVSYIGRWGDEHGR
jgi:hypothetical protein